MQHITDKELRILHYFYRQKQGYVRQIKNNISLSEHTLLKYLKLLESKKLLESRKQGNQKVYMLNPGNLLVKPLFTYFDISRIQNLESKRKRAIKGFLSGAKEIKLPYFILLFGSTAKENYTRTSDIDLVIVYDTYDKRTTAGMNDLARDISAETGLRINFTLMRMDEFSKEKNNKENHALQDALKTGYPVMGNTLYYEITLE